MEKGNEEGEQVRTKCNDIYMYIYTHMNIHTYHKNHYFEC